MSGTRAAERAAEREGRAGAVVDMSIVILSWNTRELTRNCLAALEKDTARGEREVIVVDNGSEDGSAEMVEEEFPGVVLIRNSRNLLYSEPNNQGARRATGAYLCLLNSDTEVRPGALDRLRGFLEGNPDYAAAAPKLLNMDGSVQRMCMRLPSLLVPLVNDTPLGQFPPGSWVLRRHRMRSFDHLSSRDVPQPPGACFMMKREEYLASGGLDPELALFFNDVDICRRLLRQGRRIRYVAEAEVYHHHGASVAKHPTNVLYFQNRIAYYRKHFGLLGLAWIRMSLLAWAATVWLGIWLGQKKGPRERKEAVGKLWEQVRACWGA